MKKKALIAIFVLTLVFCLAGCKGNQYYEISFEDPFIELSVFETKRFGLLTEHDEEVNVYSENENVAKVENGQVIGTGEGQTTIVARINKKSFATLEVIVKDEGFVPLLDTKEEAISIFKNSTYKVHPFVSFNGETQEATYAYSIADGNIASVDKNGNVTGLAKGQTELTVSAEFNGFSGDDCDFLRKTIPVNVSEEVIVQLESTSLDLCNQKITLGGTDYTNEAILSGFIYENGEEIDIFSDSVRFHTSDEGIVTISGNKIIAHNVGSCEVYAAYESTTGTYYSNVLKINVNLPLIAVSESIDVDLSLDQLQIDTGFMKDSSEIIERIVDIRDETRIIYVNGALTNYSSLGENTWIVQTNKYRYRLNVVCCSKIITSASELRKMVSYASKVSRTANGIISFEGYFILGNDIDMENQTFLKNVSPDFGATLVSQTGFIGIFDGRGYTISNVNVAVDNGGLFGTLNEKSVVKNVCFKNAVVSGRSGLISSYCGGTIYNCYVEGKILGSDGLPKSQKSLLASVILPNANIKNCVVNYLNADYGITFASAIGSLANARESNFENVYVIGTLDKVFGTEMKNEFETFYSALNGQFATYKDFKESVDLSNFNSYWSFGEDSIVFIR